MSAPRETAREAYIVGLGLIGGSWAKALSARAPGWRVSGWNRNAETARAALESGAVGALVPPEDNLSRFDWAVIALPPAATVATALKIIPRLRPGALLLDICGVKRQIMEAVAPAARAAGVCFIGGHPMAGREVSGFNAALENLYAGASMLLTPGGEKVPDWLPPALRAMGFARVVETTPENHDRVIAYTSQLPHLVSSAYVKSATAPDFSGYSAGSFRDLSRVAGVNAELWTGLFSANRNNLVSELDQMIAHLSAYRDALALDDRAGLQKLLQAGTDRKAALDRISAEAAGKGTPCA